jgi:hypothetical protein
LVGLLLSSGCKPPELRLSIDDVDIKEGFVRFELINQSTKTVSEINFDIMVTKPGQPAEVATMSRVVAFPLGLRPGGSEDISIRLDEPYFNFLLESSSVVVVTVRKGICSFTNVGIQSFTSRAGGSVFLSDYKVKLHNKRLFGRGKSVGDEK